VPTFSSWHIIDELIRCNGKYQDDPQVTLIVEYTTPEGNKAWGVTYRGQHPLRYLMPSPFIINPKVIWSIRGQ